MNSITHFFQFPHTLTNSHSWANQIVPVIVSAQTKLTERASKHKKNVVREKVEPAAHLDPGPEGHNVYGKVGHSLALVSVPLDTDTVLKRLDEQSKRKGGSEKSSVKDSSRILSRARTLLVRYIAGLKKEENPAITGDNEISVLLPSQLAIVVSAYDKAIDRLVSRGERDLSAQAMNELGDLFHHSGNTK